jgi:hypothetical protein
MHRARIAFFAEDGSQYGGQYGIDMAVNLVTVEVSVRGMDGVDSRSVLDLSYCISYNSNRMPNTV